MSGPKQNFAEWWTMFGDLSVGCGLENVIKWNAARKVYALYEEGFTPQQAVAARIELLIEELNGCKQKLGSTDVETTSHPGAD